MTDEQIIKALEYCSTDIRENTCPKCAFYKKHRCSTLMLNAVFDLINRQKDKIKEFDEKLVIQQGLIDYQKIEVEQWKEEANRYQNLWCIAVDDICKAKSEAIKEFAERLCKRRIENDPVVIATKAELDYVLGVGLEVQE